MRFSRGAIAGETASVRSLRHEAWLYRGREEFVAGSCSFIRDALGSDEPIMVATTPTNLDGLRVGLGQDTRRVRLVDMTQAGRNPGRIISLWREFVRSANTLGRPARAIGEPVWPAREPDELDECDRHEALLNCAFEESADFWLVCPYDSMKLSAETLASVGRTHPHIHDARGSRSSGDFDPTLGGRALSGALSPPPRTASSLTFDESRLSGLRAFVRDAAAGAGLPPERVDDFVFSVNELAANALRYGGGAGTATSWRSQASLLCEVADRGHIRDPLVGRKKPEADQLPGRGLWIVHELCDLVQIRSSAGGTRIRLTLRTAG